MLAKIITVTDTGLKKKSINNKNKKLKKISEKSAAQELSFRRARE